MMCGFPDTRREIWIAPTFLSIPKSTRVWSVRHHFLCAHEGWTLTDDYQRAEQYALHRLLGTLLSKTLTAGEKLNIIGNELEGDINNYASIPKTQCQADCLAYGFF